MTARKKEAPGISPGASKHLPSLYSWNQAATVDTTSGGSC